MSTKEAYHPDRKTEIVKELVANLPLDSDDYIGELTAQVHAKLESNWYEEKQICVDVLRETAQTIDPNRLARCFTPADQSAFFRRLPLLESVAGIVPFSADDILFIEASIPESVYNDMAGSNYLNALRVWASSFPASAVSAVEQLTADRNAGLRKIHVTLIEGLAEAVARQAIGTDVFDLLQSQCSAATPELRAGIVLSLPHQVAVGAVKLRDAEDRITAGAEDENEIVRAAAIRAIGLLSLKHPVSPRLRLRLRTVIADPSRRMRLNLLFALGRITDLGEAADKELIEEVLDSYTGTDDSEGNIIHDLGWVLFSVAARYPDLVLAFCRQWAVRTDTTVPLLHSSRFMHVISHVPLDALVPALFRWLISDVRLEEIAIEILVQERGYGEVSWSHVKDFSTHDLHIILLVLSYHDHNPDTAELLASLCLQVLLSGAHETLAEPIVTALQHLVYSYVDGAASMLAPFRASRKRTVRRLYSELTDEHERAKAALQRATQMREFRPSLDRQYIYNRFYSRFRREIQSRDIDDPGRFPISNLFRSNEVQVLGGTSILREGMNEPDTAIPLGRIEVSSELPRLELLDPDGEYLRRHSLRKTLHDLRQER